jgi:orotidine-5'-phosphate decarboxylase
MWDISEKLIVALDVDTLDDAKRFVSILYPTVKFFKVGSQLFTACGLDAIKMIGEKGGRVFLDLKFHDIPNTVYNAVASGTSATIAIHSIPSGLDKERVEDQVKKYLHPPVFMMTLHTLGGLDMLRAGVKGAEYKAAELNIKRPLLIGVTVLTSEKATSESVLERALLAREAGLDGVVCAASEISIVKKALGKEFIVVTPGIRPKGASTDDQKRIATAEEAVKAGADFLVIGRPILEAKDPLKALRSLQ